MLAEPIYLVALHGRCGSRCTGLIGERGTSFLLGLTSTRSEGNCPHSYRYRIFPTLFWINSSDQALHCVCALGVLFSLALLARLWRRCSRSWSW